MIQFEHNKIEKLYGLSDVELKIGAQVMCKTNIDLQRGISNGSVGIIIDFINNRLPKVRFDNGEEYVFKKKEYKSDNFPELFLFRFPLQLAWAITIHKSQGCTLNKAVMDLGNSIFEKDKFM